MTYSLCSLSHLLCFVLGTCAVSLLNRVAVHEGINGAGHDYGPHDSSNARLSSLKPLYWVHVPKCGTSFAEVILRHPDICPVAVQKGIGLPVIHGPRLFGDAQLWLKMPSLLCVTSVSPVFILTAVHGGIHALNTDFDDLKGHGVIMLRQPEQRIISGYNTRPNGFPHSWPKKLKGTSHMPSLKEYAEQQAGCAVKILTSSDTSPCFTVEPPSANDMEKAVVALHDNMAFVGITEEWDLSICLFHAMFGGKCHDSEFGNFHPGTNQSNQYDITPLGGFHDAFDGRLYDEAQRIFNRNLDRYGVSHSTCPSLCRKS